MKKAILFIFLMAFSFTGFSADWVGIKSNIPVPAKQVLVSSTISQSVIQFTVDGFYMNEVLTPRGNASIPMVDEGSPILEAGAPELPKLTSSLIIPDMAGMNIRVISSEFTEFAGVEIAPSKGVLMRDIDPQQVPYTYGISYQTDQFYPGGLAGLREPFIVRDLRGQTVIVYPFQYNPVTKVLRVYHDITLELFQVSETGANPFIRKSTAISIQSEWNQIYSREFLNFDALDYTPVNDYGNLLVICHGSFMDAIIPYVNWKKSIGFPTVLVDVATIGTTAQTIKDYIATYYNTNGLAHVLLVGDNAQIPTNTGGGLGGPSDNAYGYIVGNDHYIDAFIGRFSAENTGHVQTQVERTLNYEKDPQLLTNDWYTSVIGIASDQGPGDDGEYDYQHIRNLQTQCLNYTYTWNPELFDGSQGGNDAPGNPTPQQVADAVNDGGTLILYCGHGSNTSWGTSGFSNTNVNQLVNMDKLPFIWSVACVNGNFQNLTCFAEAWLRATQNGEPTGAIAFLGSTINQSWNPPMEGQDEMVAILVESYPGNIKRSFAGLSLNGCMKMIDTYGNDGQNMADTWTVFGDPTIMVRTDNPGTMTVTHDPTLIVGTSSFAVTCNVEGAKATLTLNNEILATGLVSGGSVVLTFTPITIAGDTAHLVVNAYNYIPYLADIQIIAPTGPYILYQSNAVNDQGGNNDQLVDYGENIYLKVDVKNVGIEPTANLQVKVKGSNPYIQQTDSTEAYGVVDPNQVKGIPDAYYFHVSSNIPDGAVIPFEMTAVDGSGIWTSSFSIMAHAPNLVLSETEVLDPSGNNNGRLDPGETANLKLTLLNSGSSEAFNVTGNLVSISPHVTVVSDSKNFGNLQGGQSNFQEFSVNVDPAAPEGQSAPFLLEISADRGLATVATFELVIGRTPVLVIDLDGNNNSGPFLEEAALSLGLLTDYVQEVPDVMDDYISVFACLGISPEKHILTSAEGQRMKDFLNSGGRAYMEGGDTWKGDPSTPVHPLFHILGINNGGGDLGTIQGLNGAFTEGMSFQYTGDNYSIDRITYEGTAWHIFKNVSPIYYNAIAYDGGTFRTVGSSYEFGGLADGSPPSTKQNLMKEYLTFFGISIPSLAANFAAYPTSVFTGQNVNFYNFSTGAVASYEWSFPGGTPSTSTEENPVVFYFEPGLFDVTLTVSDGIGTSTLVKEGYVVVDFATGIPKAGSEITCNVIPNPNNGQFELVINAPGSENISLRITNMMGTHVYSENGIPVSGKFQKQLSLSDIPNGLYILTVMGETSTSTKKIIIRK
jgi:PKD repeat protein